MDEVDIDNVDDLNELEARLYAQIHHEATDVPNDEILNPPNENDIQQTISSNKAGDNIGHEQNYETSYHTNNVLSRRYWSNGGNTLQQQQRSQESQQNKRFVRNPFKTSNQGNQQKGNYANSVANNLKFQNQNSKDFESETLNPNASSTATTNEKLNSIQNNSSSTETNAEKLNTINQKEITSNSSISDASVEQTKKDKSKVTNENKKCKNVENKTDRNEVQKPTATPPIEKSNFKLNPVTDWMKRNKLKTTKKSNINKRNMQAKEGPFGKQQEKLQKAKRLMEKKQKSRNARNTATAVAKKLQPTEIIDLDSDNESDSSDVIMVPLPPTPTLTVEDSTDEDDQNNTQVILEHEENALDSADVEMSSTSSRFIKPQQNCVQSSEGSDKRLENSSRCTSPCSIQSSDDFIGQNDRSRLLTSASGMADDEDLLVLTSDMNSLLEAPQSLKQSVHNENNFQKDVQQQELNVEEENQNIQTNDSLEFTPPKASELPARPKDYRVDERQFRAIDVYESESDITDSVYSKGTGKPTVIRQIDTSSDDVEDIGSCSQRTKRLRKRRASSSNKESDDCNKIFASSSDEEDENNDALDDENKLLRTGVPFIARGPAVERCKLRKRSSTVSNCSPIVQKRKSTKTTGLPDHMSDTEFIATLNNLAQGQEGGKEEDNQEIEDEDGETLRTPSAREIAEKILARHRAEEIAKKSQTEDVAIPEDVINELDQVFEAIDQMDKQGQNRTQTSTPDDAVKISDSSDSDIEKRLIYKTVPNDRDTQIIKVSSGSSHTKSTPLKTRTENGSPIYNVVYSRGQRKPGGLGWNEEMRKFYNDSWNGEHFILSKILQKMNPDKSLWKIYTEDRFNIKSNRRNNLKCSNCCEFGHMRSKCKRPRKPMVCYMCGESNHQEPRCPNTICLRCGAKTQIFTKSCNSCIYQNRLICPICKIRGHTLDYCPDKWRRYHSTTEPNVIPNSYVHYNPRKYCCICGARGHLSDNCRSSVRFMEYPTIVSTIKSHQRAYNDVAIKTPHNGIGLNLMYEPCQEYNFDLVERTSLDKYYGRFLKAVGLDFLLTRKRHRETVHTEVATDTSAKKAKRLSEKYVANPYSKIGTANQQNTATMQDAPNQVQEITESGNCTDNEANVEPVVVNDVINIEDNSGGTNNEVEFIESTVNDISENIQLNIINETSTAFEHNEENFKSPKNISSNFATISKNPAEPPLVLDSDSNYSFSEHFDVNSKAVDTTISMGEVQVVKLVDEESTLSDNSRPKPRAMEVLPDFIPLIDSTSEQIVEDNNDDVTSVGGISKRFVSAETDEEVDDEHATRRQSPLPELPCEAKIYLTHLHSKYLLSPIGNAFLVKTSRAHSLKARLDFTSVGHVLVIFGLPNDQDNFQRELLLKYRQLTDENNQKLSQSIVNVPKRTDVLIRFLRENITQLLNNLGNVNHLLKRLQFLERQQSKSGYKLAEKVRRSLNMILVGQAGLKDGTMHLDKLLKNLKTLINDYNSNDVTPPQLRSEISDHWKVIFSSYRHENYQQLVDTYNKLISKNRMPKLIIDPILLGHKLLDTSISEEQKQKLEQARTPIALNENMSKRKQNTSSASTSEPASVNNKLKTSRSRPASPNKALQSSSSGRADNSSSPANVKSKTNVLSAITPLKAKGSENIITPIRVKTLNSTASVANKTKAAASTPRTTSSATAIPNKKQTQKIMPPPPFANPEKRSTVCTAIQDVSNKWKSTCDTLLMEISSDKPSTTTESNGGRLRESKLPSTFWSRESMRYLADCVRIASARENVIDKLKRVQNKAKNGQLSYNDYLAVIKLHSAICGK